MDGRARHRKAQRRWALASVAALQAVAVMDEGGHVAAADLFRAETSRNAQQPLTMGHQRLSDENTSTRPRFRSALLPRVSIRTPLDCCCFWLPERNDGV